MLLREAIVARRFINYVQSLAIPTEIHEVPGFETEARLPEIDLEAAAEVCREPVDP